MKKKEMVGIYMTGKKEVLASLKQNLSKEIEDIVGIYSIRGYDTYLILSILKDIIQEGIDKEL